MEQSTDWFVKHIPPIIPTAGRSESQLMPMSESGWTDITKEQGIKVVSSKDLGDPDLGTVLDWHMYHCDICYVRNTPAIFGRRPSNFCDEYWEIVQEYADYEIQYAWKGNP